VYIFCAPTLLPFVLAPRSFQNLESHTHLTNSPKQEDGPLRLTYIQRAVWCPELLPRGLPGTGRPSHHEGIPENSACDGKVYDVLGCEMGENLMIHEHGDDQ
jgi:hypothetical protein